MLVVFDAVCRFKNMTRAAQEINASQPAVSRYIKEFTHVIGQELFIKTKQGLELTVIAQDIWEKTKVILADCEHLTQYSEEKFSPETTPSNFTIAVSLMNTGYLLRKLVLHTIDTYPTTQINLFHMSPEKAMQALESREIAAYLGNRPNEISHSMSEQEICTFGYKVICSKKHIFSDKKTITKDEFVNTPHVRIRTVAKIGYLDRALMEKNIMPEDIRDVPDIASVLTLIKHTGILYMSPAGFAQETAEKDDDIIVLEPKNFELPQSQIYLIWNKSNTDYEPHQWLREYVSQQLNF